MAPLTKEQQLRIANILKELAKLAKTEKRVRFSTGTNKARELRDLIQANGGQMHSADLKRQRISLGDMKLSHLVTPQGHLTSEALQRHIESQPVHEYKVTDTSHGIPLDHMSPAQGNAEATNMFLQRHSHKPSQLTRFELTPDLEQKLREAGVLDTFHKFNDFSQKSGHPVNKDTIGWVRHNEGPEGIHIDEIQSDMPKDFNRLLESQKNVMRDVKSWSPEQVEMARKYHPQGHMIGQIQSMPDDRIEGLAQQVAGHFPPDHFTKIHDILFEGKEPSQVLHEAFLQHQRNEGKVGKRIAMWTPESKGKMALAKPDAPIPAHMRQGYGDIPKKMGYKPAQYGSLDVQSNDMLSGRPTQEMALRKSQLDWSEFKEPKTGHISYGAFKDGNLHLAQVHSTPEGFMVKHHSVDPDTYSTLGLHESLGPFKTADEAYTQLKNYVHPDNDKKKPSLRRLLKP